MFKSDSGEQGTEDGGYAGMGGSFGDKAVRLGFIRKVYSLLCAQLTLTMAFIGIFFIPAVSGFARENTWLLYTAMAFSFVMLITLACVPSIRRKSPHNMIFLGLFTVCEGWLVGAICSTYQVTEVLIAVGVTAGVVLALTVFAMQTKIDFTAWGGALLAVLVVFVLVGLVAAFFPQTRTVRLVYASVGAIIFSLYIVFDTQMMMGGNHKYSLDPEEYVFASLNLYLDIINLFMYLLQIIGIARN
jgi:FtsH-binding integral membrane protein